MMIDFGEDVGQCVLGTDSSSAKSIIERSGAGRIRQSHCPMLWPQERVDSVETSTIPRTLGSMRYVQKYYRHLKTLKMEWRKGRLAAGLQE